MLFQVLRTARQVHPEPGWWDWFSRIKYCVRGLLMQRLTREWFELLGEPKLDVVAQNHPHIFSKLQRAYLHRSLGTKSRFQALKNHYRFVTLQLSGEAVDRVYGSSDLFLAQVPLVHTGSLDLRLSYYDSLSKEGEMSLTVHDGDTGALLAALSFCVTRYEVGSKQVFIGGLQGFTTPGQKDQIITITRGLYGLRPKAILLFTLQQLTAVWQLDSIRAVSDGQHVYRHYRKRKKVDTSYDEFWLESGGLPGEDGLFTLPTAFAPRDLSGMKASKRQMYRRRYLMLDELAIQIRDSALKHTELSNGTIPSPNMELVSQDFDFAT
jgi:uncharacterized protein VirK/YbjX